MFELWLSYAVRAFVLSHAVTTMSESIWHANRMQGVVNWCEHMQKLMYNSVAEEHNCYKQYLQGLYPNKRIKIKAGKLLLQWVASGVSVQFTRAKGTTNYASYENVLSHGALEQAKFAWLVNW